MYYEKTSRFARGDNLLLGQSHEYLASPLPKLPHKSRTDFWCMSKNIAFFNTFNFNCVETYSFQNNYSPDSFNHPSLRGAFFAPKQTLNHRK